MDQYLFNYLCLNHLVELSNKSKLKIKYYFKEIQNINWHYVDRNRSYFEIDVAVKLPVGNEHNIMKESAQKFYRKLNDLDTAYTTPRDLNYPNRFKMFEPLSDLIYYKGNKDLLNSEKSVAVVGTRNPSIYGKKVAMALGRFLGQQGINVVSGLALGIDGIAHEGALSVGGKTSAVLASGVNRAYPSSHKGLYQSILESNGLIISESALSEQPMKYHFPLRNRLISGMADAIVIVEASEKSGTLITARYGLEQGRLIFSVPGSIYHKNAKGTNQLIYDGAIPLIDFDDIISCMNWENEKKFTNVNMCELSENSRRVYKMLLVNKTIRIVELQHFLGADMGVVNAVVAELVFNECCEFISIDEIQIK